MTEIDELKEMIITWARLYDNNALALLIEGKQDLKQFCEYSLEFDLQKLGRIQKQLEDEENLFNKNKATNKDTSHNSYMIKLHKRDIEKYEKSISFAKTKLSELEARKQ